MKSINFFFLLSILILLNCSKNDSTDENVQFFGDESFTYYPNSNIKYEDSELLIDESLMIAGYDGNNQNILLTNSDLSFKNEQFTDIETKGYNYNICLSTAADNNISYLTSSFKASTGIKFDIVLRKVDQDGETYFNKIIGGSELNEIAMSHVALPNGDFIVLSLASDNYLQNEEYNFYRISESGEVILSEIVEESHLITHNGKIIYSPSDNSIVLLNDLGSSNDAIIKATKLDLEGKVLETKVLITNQAYWPNSSNLAILNDGSLIIYYSVQVNEELEFHMKVMKLNPDFSLIWDKEYTEIEPNFIIDLIEGDSGDLYILSTSIDIGAGINDIILTKLDSQGTIKWRSVIGGELSELGYKIFQKKNNNILIIGSQDRIIGSEKDFRLFTLETDPNGVPI